MAPTTSEDDWDWAFTGRAEDQLAQLPSDDQQRIIDKLDDAVDSEWRDPGEFLDPLADSPFQKLRVGDYRLGCRVLYDSQVLRVESVRKRDGAYSGDD